MNWYVIRCYMRDFTQVTAQIDSLALESHETIECFEHPLFQHAFFLQCTEAFARVVSRSIPVVHFQKERNGSRIRLVSLPDGVMEMVQIALSAHDGEVSLKEEGCLDHLAGDAVEIIAGPFKGIKGVWRRFGNSRHVCFDVPGLCTVCTPYIAQDKTRKI